MKGKNRFISAPGPALLFFLFLLNLTSGCGSDSIRLENADLERWKSDRKGCNGERKSIVHSIVNQKEKILAASEASVVETLGKPDQVELYKRNQKLYHYRLSPGPECAAKDSTDLELLIRFNAMGRAKEIFTTP